MRLTPVTSHVTPPAEMTAREAVAPASLAQIEPIQSASHEPTRDAAMRATRLARLIGARVPGGIDFSGSAPAPRGPSIPLYRRPADANAIATQIAPPAIVDLRA